MTPPGEKIRVAVCDDHELFRRGVAEMLSVAGEGIEVVGEARTLDEAVAVVAEHGPDVVLLDLEMPGGMGADEAMGRMLGLSPPPGVAVYTMHDEPGMVRRFLSRGAAAYLAKSALTDELVEAVREAAAAGPPSPSGADAVHAPGDAPENPPEATQGGREGR